MGDAVKLLVTGGCGFIGSNFIRFMLKDHPTLTITNLDLLTYAGNPTNLRDIEKDSRYSFVHGDICDDTIVTSVIEKYDIDAIVHFAAESHVDRSIVDPSTFTRTNVLGTQTLLSAAVSHKITRFIQVSTDEVYGSRLKGSFKEGDSLSPTSPYAASKAGADLLVSAYHTTYNLPVIITRCTNNFGPYQYPEKLIPLFVTNLLEGKKVPLYGTGLNVRDWIYVLDNCRAIDFLIDHGKVGEIYNIAGGNERTNLDITQHILNALNMGEASIDYVNDRPGHDFRYSLDSSKLRSLGWSPKWDFLTALHETIQWYKDNEWWWKLLKPPRELF